MLASLFILFLIFSLSLFAFGLIGRQIGEEPRCRSCKYDLTGAVANNCPECGTPIGIDSVRWGLRRRRPIALMASILLIAATTTGIYVNVRSVRWLPHYPFQLVSFMGRRGDANAVSELWRRWRATELTSSQLRELILASLDAQAAPKTDATTPTWMMLLDEFDASGVLAAEEHGRFLAQMIHSLDLKTAHRLREGEKLPLALTPELRVRDFAQCTLRQGTVTIGRTKYSFAPEHRFRAPQLFLNAESQFFIDLNEKPGNYSAKFVLEVDITDMSMNQPIASRQWKFSRPLEIVSRDVSQQVSMIDPTGLNPGQAPWLSARPGLYSRNRVQGETPVDTIELDLTARSNLPLSIAFDVFAASNGMMSQLGTIYGWKDCRFVMSNLRPVDRSELDGDTLDLVLRSNSSIADRTVDLHQVINGEYRLSVKVDWPDAEWSSHGGAGTSYFQRFNDLNNSGQIRVVRTPPSHFSDTPPIQHRAIRASPFPTLSRDDDAESMFREAVQTFESDARFQKIRQESFPSRSNYYDGAGWDLKRRDHETPHRKAIQDAINLHQSSDG